MKFLIVFALAVVAVVVAVPVEKKVEVVEESFDTQPEGSYSYNFRLDDGSFRSEQGVTKEVLDEENKPRTVVVARGSYGYTDSEGKQEKIEYYADETGYHAEGPSVPKVARR